MSHSHVHICTVLLCLTLSSSSEPEKQLRLYFEFSPSISDSHCCFALVWLGYLSVKFTVLGLLTWGFCTFGWGGIFCCWILFSSFSWFLQKGTILVPIHTFLQIVHLPLVLPLLLGA